MSGGGRLRAAVLGSPISHSLSPQLHSAAYEFLGLGIDYTRIEVTQDQAGEFLSRRANEFVGLSVTMPLKMAMVEHMTTVSERVRTLGVLNTVLVSTGGPQQTDPPSLSLHGENTDVDGMITALREQGLDVDHGTGSLGILGAGGTAAAALAAAADMGFGAVRVYARSAERAVAIPPLGERLGMPVVLRPLDALAEDIGAGVLQAVISTLPPRAADDLAARIPGSGGSDPVLLDVAYDPWPSALAKTWIARGWPVCSGKAMLLHQAVKQVELFTEDSQNPAAGLSQGSHAAMVERMRCALTV